jgi:radical SAM protein (TIGR01212 family)
MGLDKFKEIVLAATEDPDLVGVAISTRPDCINDDYLAFLSELQDSRKLDVDIELGLQTVNYHNLVEVNRGHTLAEYIDAVLRIKRYGLSTTAHVILNLPGDDMLDVIETAKIISTLGVDFVKLHSLYVVGHTELGRRYKNGEFTMITLQEYVERVVTFLEYLNPEIVVQRLVGKGPQDDLLFCNWDTSWWKIKDAIDAEFIARNSRQGSRFDYLNGRAIRNRR